MPTLTADVETMPRQPAGPKPAPSDAQFVRRFVAEQDEGAFAALVDRHGPLVWGVCRRALGQAQDAEDAFQATFLVLAWKAGRLRDADRLAAWLHGVAYRAALEIRSQRRRHARERPMTGEVAVAAPGPAESAEQWELVTLLDQEVAKLPEKLRTAVVLCELEGRSRQEAALALNIPEGTLSSRLAAARERLTARFQRLGLACTATLLALLLRQLRAEAGPPRPAVVAGARGQGAGPHAGALADGPVAAVAQATLKGMLRAQMRLPAAAFAAALLLAALLWALWPAAEPLANAAPPNKPPPFAWGVAAAPDGKTLAVSEGHNLIRLWDLETRQPGPALEGPAKIIRHLAFSPDGKLLAGGGDEGTVFLWELPSRQLLRKFEGHRDSVHAVAFAPDGRRLATASQPPPVGQGDAAVHPPGDVRLWTLDGKLERRIEADAALTFGAGAVLAFTPDGKELATLHAGTFVGVRFWDLATGKETQRLPTAPGLLLQALAISPDGTRLALCDSGPPPEVRPNLFGFPVGAVRLWDRRTGKLERTLVERVDGFVKSVAFSPDGKRVFAATPFKTGEIKQQDGGMVGRVANVACCWEVESGKLLWDAEGRGGMVFGLALTPDGKRLAIADSAGCWAVADVATGKGKIVLWQSDD